MNPENPYYEMYQRIGEVNQGISSEGGDERLTKMIGRFTVSPERVADTVLKAAESSDPKARYNVSLPHRTMAMGRYLPSSVRDWMFNRSL